MPRNCTVWCVAPHTGQLTPISGRLSSTSCSHCVGHPPLSIAASYVEDCGGVAGGSSEVDDLGCGDRGQQLGVAGPACLLGCLRATPSRSTCRARAAPSPQIAAHPPPAPSPSRTSRAGPAGAACSRAGGRRWQRRRGRRARSCRRHSPPRRAPQTRSQGRPRRGSGRARRSRSGGRVLQRLSCAAGPATAAGPGGGDPGPWWRVRGGRQMAGSPRMLVSNSRSLDERTRSTGAGLGAPGPDRALSAPEDPSLQPCVWPRLPALPARSPASRGGPPPRAAAAAAHRASAMSFLDAREHGEAASRAMVAACTWEPPWALPGAATRTRGHCRGLNYDRHTARPPQLPPPPPPPTACPVCPASRRLQARQRLRVGPAGGARRDRDGVHAALARPPAAAAQHRSLPTPAAAPLSP